MTEGLDSSRVCACMPSNKTTAIIEMLAIGFGAPLLGLSILAVVARIWKPDLRELLPWLRAFRWIAWLVGVLFIAPEFLGMHRYYWPFFPIGGGLVPCSSGLEIVEAWVKRRYAPKSFRHESPDGYWPSPPHQ
jgi:hypothetical protein